MWLRSYWLSIEVMYFGCPKVYIDEEVLPLGKEDNGPSFIKEEQN